MTNLPSFKPSADRHPASILKACGQWMADAVTYACDAQANGTIVEISGITENYNASNPESSSYTTTLTFTGQQASSTARVMKNSLSSTEINFPCNITSAGDGDAAVSTLTIQAPSRVMRMINRATAERDYPLTENMEIAAGHFESVCSFLAENPHVAHRFVYALQLAFDINQAYPDTIQAHPSFHFNPIKGHYIGDLVISTSEPAIINALLSLNLDASYSSETSITASVPEEKFQQLTELLQGPAVPVSVSTRTGVSP